jgi:hypothetical protein
MNKLAFLEGYLAKEAGAKSTAAKKGAKSVAKGADAAAGWISDIVGKGGKKADEILDWLKANWLGATITGGIGAGTGLAVGAPAGAGVGYLAGKASKSEDKA